MYSATPSEHSIERSLLQKAIRRGNADLTEKVVRYLIHAGDVSWLRRRLAVITYEECWQLGPEIRFDNKEGIIVEQFNKLAVSVKNKNASGLASLANDYKEGNYSVIKDRTPEEVAAIKSIANAMVQPSVFWRWIINEPGYKRNQNRIDSAKEVITKANFPTDKAMMLAAAYLSVKGQVPELKFADPQNDTNFPYWIAIDKHTEVGKDIFVEACNKLGLLPSRGMIIAFFLEGSLCNNMSASPYWNYLIYSELKRIGYNMEEAEKIWKELKPIIINMSSKKVQGLLERINKPIPPKEDSQLTLF